MTKRLPLQLSFTCVLTAFEANLFERLRPHYTTQEILSFGLHCLADASGVSEEIRQEIIESIKRRARGESDE
jgi:hypothetical protein